ncbi:hypothetical protein HPB48_019072 [Haemaphysalis longicornis]|uniref:Helicase C-terminal domain-containing protein n=1 Tax=Haemaphysalis longicornis TaxID=44386 RepID=A0A9J6GJV0_HAELO|nr:hypothetical protein HPB48_019072 [Haemaphysalis longicornis]
MVDFQHALFSSLLGIMLEDTEKRIDFVKLHGEMSQHDRAEVFNRFREATSGALFTTDVTSRGQYVPQVDLIVQCCVPLQPEEYVHRAGRTARIGAKGKVVLLLFPSEVGFLDVFAQRNIQLDQWELKGVLLKVFTIKSQILEARTDPGQKPKTMEDFVAALQLIFESEVCKEAALQAMAKKDFLSHVRSHASYPLAALHLGHLAKAYCLRETPSTLGAQTSPREARHAFRTRKQAGETCEATREEYEAANPCELNCRPEGERFYYRHSPKTIDGTRCHDDGSLDVCINGACMPVGCDKMLGSDAVEDKCRKCRGDGTSCSTIEGVFDLDNLEVGYNDILLIPTGATNIRIEEKFPTNNNLAVRNKTGYYYLNGNWRIEFPRSIRFAGTVFHYERRNHGAIAPESLVALGPTTETILIVLLYQEKNLGITYEYSVPVGVSQPQPGTYIWNSGDFGECSQTCGGGMQSRPVYCSNAITFERVPDDLCNPTIKPQATKVCNPEPCPASWYVGEWEKCSKTCVNSTQFRLVFCHYQTEGGIVLANDSDCLSSVGPKPERLRECSSEAECASWEAGNWTEASGASLGLSGGRPSAGCL